MQTASSRTKTFSRSPCIYTVYGNKNTSHPSYQKQGKLAMAQSFRPRVTNTSVAFVISVISFQEQPMKGASIFKESDCIARGEDLSNGYTAVSPWRSEEEAQTPCIGHSQEALPAAEKHPSLAPGSQIRNVPARPRCP